MNKIFTLIIYIIILLLLCGCWNYKEVEDLALVAGMAVDKSTHDYLDITLEVLNLGVGDINVKPISEKLESQGKTVYDALTNSLKISAKKLFWSHAMSIVISEDVAKVGISPILDWVYRDLEPRLTLQIFISKENTAKEILSVKSLTTDIRSFEIDAMLKSDKFLSKTPSLELYELMNEINSKEIYPVLPALESYMSDGKLTVALAGGAIFNHNKLAGFLEPDDVKYYLFVRNKIQAGTLLIDNTINDKKDIVTLNVIKNKAKINPIIKDEELTMKIDINTYVDIVEIDSNFGYLSTNGQQILKTRSEQFLTGEIERVIKMVQKDYGLDIFGFGQIIKDKMPNLWKEIEEDWDSIFQELNIEVNTVIKIKSSGHSKIKE